MVIVHLYGNEIGYVKVVPVNKGVQYCLTKSRNWIIPNVLSLYPFYIIADTNVLPQDIQCFFKLLKKISFSPFIINYGGFCFETSYPDAEISKVFLWILTKKKNGTIS